METILTLDDIKFPLGSARGIRQTLTPIQGGMQLARDVNGNLQDLSLPTFRKYASNITCQDMQAPTLNGVWVGKIILVGCICELSYVTVGGTPSRPLVPGSSRIEGAFTFYRPLLTMMITSLQSADSDEFSAVVGWSMDLEEV